MEYEIITQLKKDFYSRIRSIQTESVPQSQCKPTLSLLTEEELKQLEQIWVELTMWKINQRH